MRQLTRSDIELRARAGLVLKLGGYEVVLMGRRFERYEPKKVTPGEPTLYFEYHEIVIMQEGNPAASIIYEHEWDALEESEMRERERKALNEYDVIGDFSDFLGEVMFAEERFEEHCKSLGKPPKGTSSAAWRAAAAETYAREKQLVEAAASIGIDAKKAQYLDDEIWELTHPSVDVWWPTQPDEQTARLAGEGELLKELDRVIETIWRHL